MSASQRRRSPLLRAATIGSLAVTAVSLAACSTMTVRQAQEVTASEEPAPVESAGSDGPVGTHVGRSLGTLVCITNKTRTAFSVDFTKYDSATENAVVPVGGRACAEGTFVGSPDVSGTMTPERGMQVWFSGYNPAIGQPTFRLTNADKQGVCGGWTSMETNVFDDGFYRYTVTRNPDTGWKDFSVVVEDGQVRESFDCSNPSGERGPRRL